MESGSFRVLYPCPTHACLEMGASSETRNRSIPLNFSANAGRVAPSEASKRENT